MVNHHISTLVIVQNNRPIGIFTERSLVRLKTTGTLVMTAPIQDVMTPHPIVANKDMGSHEAYQLFLQHHIRHLIVVDDRGLLAGIVTETDFCHHLGLEYFVAFMDISNIMAPDVIALHAEEAVIEAIQLMNNHNISSVIIEEKHIPIGIITERDIVRLTQANIDVATTSLCEVMSNPVHTVAMDTPSHKAAKLMKETRIRRLVVTDQKGRLAGIVTATDIIKGLKSDYTELLRKVIKTQADQLQKVHRQMDDKAILESMMYSTADIAFAVADLDYRILHYNNAAERIFSYSAQEVLNKTILDICDQKSVNLALLKKIETIIRQEGKYHLVHEKQKKVPFSI